MEKVHRVCTENLKCKAYISRDPETKQVTGSAHCDAFDNEELTKARRMLQEIRRTLDNTQTYSF